MALSQDEQRVLAEIERRLAAEDPRLASSLATFRRPTPSALLRSPRARIIGTVFSVLLVAGISLMFYAMSPFRYHGGRTPAPPSASQDHATIATTANASQLHPTQQAPSASGGASIHTAVGTPNSAASSSRPSPARAHSSTAPNQATGRTTPAVGGP